MLGIFGSIMEVASGFGVRKRYANPSKFDGTITSCRFVCRKERHRAADKRDRHTKQSRAEIRTGCLVRMGLSIDREVGNYEVFDFVLEHNHALQLQETCHVMPSQHKISDIQAFEIEIADDSGIGPKAAHELASRRVGGSSILSYTRQDHKNYLHSKRQRQLMYGEAGSMLKYFQDRTVENPFQYAIQLDCEEQITNIFWADAKMIIDYAHFGDVITFDTTFGTNKEYRPFGVFVGFNHFRETVIFSASLLYDETFESFKWFFDTFLSIHNQKHPRTIYTDQDIAMGRAIEHVFPEARHGLCTFHIMQNAIKHLSCHRNSGSNLLADFSACMYEYEDKATLCLQTIKDRSGRNVVENPMLDTVLRYKFLSHKFVNLATQAARSEECCILIENTLGSLSKEVEGRMKNARQSNLDDRCDTQVIPQESNALSAARLKKKPAQKRSSKRKLTWIDRQHKKGKKGPTRVTKAQELPKQQQNGIRTTQTQFTVENDYERKQNDFQSYGFIKNYTQLLTGSSVTDMYAEDIF